MTQQGVRKTIESHVVSQVGLRNSVEPDLAASSISVQTAPDLSHTVLGDSIMSEFPPAQETVPMDPLYVSDQRELEELFRDMLPSFEGRESEHNWMVRDKNVMKIRRLTKGNGPTEFRAAFVPGVKSCLDGILKVANSLRTTVSSNGSQCIQELARTLGPGLDPMVEILIQNFIKTSAATKKIAAENGNATVDIILQNVSYSARLMHHMLLSFQDKNVQTRSYASGWLATLIKKHANQKAHIEHSGGLDVAQQCLKKGLADANPKVREGTRGAFWQFARVWPDHAETIMNTLDPKSKGQLEKDSRNPHAGSLSASVSSTASVAPKVRPGLPPGRPSVRDAILAQRKAALESKGIPDRPSSAQSHFSPVKSKPTPRAPSGRSVAGRPPSAFAREPPASVLMHRSGSLLSAPVRRPRPQVPRPKTADPYADSRRANAQTPTLSPNNSPDKSIKATTRASTRTPASGRAYAPTTSSTVRSKSRLGSTIPKPSPRRATAGATDSPLSSPAGKDSAVPFSRPPDDDNAYTLPPQRSSRLEKSVPMDGAMQDIDDEGFTMVLPNLRSHAFDDKPVLSASQSKSNTPQKSSTPQKSLTPRLSPIKAASTNSPSLLKRLRSPPTRSPDRARSPMVTALDLVGVEPVVQVYEDPFVGDEEPARSDEAEKPVLEELPLNGKANERDFSEEPSAAFEPRQSTRSNEQNTPRHHKTTSTGSVIINGDTSESMMQQDHTETLRSRRLLASGIERIRAKTLDAHGFRRVQNLVKSNQDIWGDDSQRFGELLSALLSYLEASNDSLRASGEASSTSSATKAQNLKTQALTTLRAMLAVHRKESAPYYSRALCSVLMMRKWFEESMHISSDIERTAEDIIKFGQPNDSINAVLDLVEGLSGAIPGSPSSSTSSTSDPSTSPVLSGTQPDLGGSNSRTVVLSLSVLGSLLSVAQAKNIPLSSSQTQRLGHAALKFLQDTDADVRKADVDFCLVMHRVLRDEQGGEGKEGEAFWKMMRGVGIRENNVNLITYYLAKKMRA